MIVSSFKNSKFEKMLKDTKIKTLDGRDVRMLKNWREKKEKLRKRMRSVQVRVGGKKYGSSMELFVKW